MIAARTAPVLAAVACALLATAACSGSAKVGPTTYVTVDAPPATTATPSTSASTSVSASASTPAPSATTTPARMTKLPGECASLLPLGSIDDALGRKVGDTTDFVVGVPDPTIARIGYLNCRYGVTSKTAPADVEIGISLYRTAAKAEARLEPTVTDYAAHGAQSSTVQVAGRPATLLTGGSGPGYGPTLVLVDGQRTIAVSLRSGSVASTQVAPDLTKLAALAAEQTSAG